MEINITILFQALIFLMLLITLSVLLFKPMKFLTRHRENLILKNNDNILKLGTYISHQNYHIRKKIFLTQNKISKIDKYLCQYEVFKEYSFYKRIQFTNFELQRNNDSRLKKELFLAIKHFEIQKCLISIKIKNKLYRS
jgi:hypothetical protein